MDSLRSKTRRPTHPGAILRDDVLPELKLTQAEFADRLGVSRRTVSEILHERRPVTPDMAMRLGKLLGNGPGDCQRSCRLKVYAATAQVAF